MQQQSRRGESTLFVGDVDISSWQASRAMHVAVSNSHPPHPVSPRHPVPTVVTLPPPPVSPRPSPGVPAVARLSSTSSAPTLTRIPQLCRVSPPPTRTLSRRASTDAPVCRPIPAAKDDDIDYSSAMNRARVVARTALTSSGNYGEEEGTRPTPRLRQPAGMDSVATRAATLQSPHSNYSILPMSPEQPLSDGEYGVLSLAPADNHHRRRLTSNRRR